MADQNPSPKAQDPEPTVHAYDNPHLGPRAFLLAVMHSAEVPIRDRIRAASELLRIYGEESFRPRLTYRIEGIPDCYSLSTEAEVGPTDGTTEIGSHVSPGSHIAPRHSDDNPGPSTLREHPDPLYSQPLSPTEIQEIKAVVDHLRPDLAHLPTPEFHLCPCGHWITGTYPCCKARTDKTKLN